MLKMISRVRVILGFLGMMTNALCEREKLVGISYKNDAALFMFQSLCCSFCHVIPARFSLLFSLESSDFL